MKKKIIAIAAIVALVAVLATCLVACNKEPKPGYTPVAAQADILTELNSRTADVGLLDYTMASYLIGQQTSLTKNLQIVDDIKFEEEQYGIAFRKGSTGFADIINKALAALQTDGTITQIAQKYGLADAIIPVTYEEDADANFDDWNYIKNKGTVIIGCTLNPPMAISDNGQTPSSGYDYDLPIAVIDWINKTYELNLRIEFQVIDWNNKEIELNSKNVDCLWNGMTITPERAEAMTISAPYLINRQVVVIRKDDAGKYTDYESLKNARIVAEQGSAGEEIAQQIFA